MGTEQVLFAGGTGVVGREAIGWFRSRYPGAPILVGGRDLSAATAIADEAGDATAVRIDLGKPDLGIATDIPVSAVVMVAPDDSLHGVRFAQSRGVPYVSIANGLAEISPELALFAHRPTAAPIVIASHWLAGAAVFLAVGGARRFDVVDSIRIGVVSDPDDPAGPSAMDDMERLQANAPAALAFVHGRREWLSSDTSPGRVEAVDGRELSAVAYSPFDVVGLFAATDAPDIRFDLATGESSSRLRGGPVSAEIVVEIEGQTNGARMTSRSTLEFEHGQASLTGLSVVLALSGALGLDEHAPATAGLYLPEALLDTEWVLRQYEAAGVVLTESV